MDAAKRFRLTLRVWLIFATFPDPANEYASGDIFPRGTHALTYYTMDEVGNMDECSFNVTVNEFPEDLQVTSLACNDHVNISLDQGCEAIITPDMILEGGPYGCYEDYVVTISDMDSRISVTGNESDAVTVTAGPGWNGMAGPYTAKVTDPNTGNSCWGTFMLEDKFPVALEGCVDVVLVCADVTDPLLPVGTSLVGTVSGTAANATGIFNLATAEDMIPVVAPAGSVVIDIDVVAKITHTWVGDMAIELESPDGTIVKLLSDLGQDPVTMPGGCRGDDLDLVFDDEAVDDYATLYGMCSNNIPTAAGTFQPEEPLSAFDGETVAGDWVVKDKRQGFFFHAVPSMTFSVIITTHDIETYSAPIVAAGDGCGPTVTCAPPQDVTLSAEECDDILIERTWTCTDTYGNEHTCSHLITILRSTILSFPILDPLIELDCDDPVPDVGEGVGPIICGTVVSAYSDQVIPACGGLCGDEIFKAIRTWTIIDWCDAASGPVTMTQVIKRTDKEPPTISEITGDSLVSANPWNCVYSGPLPTVWAHDACSEYTSVLVSGSLEDGSPMVIIGNNVFDAPKGTHVLTYTVSDCCGNVTTKNLNFVVFDGSAPTVITLQNIVISLTSDGTTDRGTGRIHTYHVDNGSYDGCTGVYLEVRRPAGDPACGNVNPIFNPPHNQNVTYDNTNHPQDHNRDLDGGAYVKVCCADLTDEEDGVRFGMVKVWLRVWDDADMDGVYGSSGDNYNEGWTDVRVEDKSTPILICPPDVELTCDMDYNDLDMTGTARAFGICGDLDVWYNDQGGTNACNVGTIFRFWYIDFNGNQMLDGIEATTICGPQEITIDSPYEFDGQIDWPRDQVNNPPNCDRAPGEPSWNDTPCSLVAWTLTASDTFEFEDGACFKVLNYFTVIDWCQFDEDDCDLNLIYESCDDGLVPGYWTHIQEVKYLDNDPPEMDCNDECFNVDAACINHEVILKNTAFDAGACDTVVWLKWHVEVDLWGDGIVDVLFTSFDESIPGAIRVPVVPTASGEELSLNLGVPPANLTIPGSMYNHKVVWKVTDGCGNVTSCSSTFMVTDKKAPTPYCVDVSTALMEGDPGMVEVWACDFDLGSYDNCSDSEDLWFTFSEVGPGVEWVQSAGDYAYNLGHYFNNSGQFMRLFEWPHPANYVNGTWHYWDGSNCEGHIFTECGENEVRMYVWDEKAQLAWRGEVDAEIFGGNIDYCTITMTIGGENCEGQGREIGGHVNTEFGEGVTDIEMTNDADALGNQFPVHQMTDAGDYVFADNVLGINYVLSGNSNTDYMNGVSTLDLLIIQKHILGIRLLDSPYKVIAADINDNEDVSATDLLILRKLILGVFDELPSNVSWIAVDADQVFADILDPFPVDKYKEVDNLQDNMMAEDFVAVKIGDVNLSAEANAQSVSSESRSNASLKLEVADADMAVGTVKVDVTSGNFASIYGYQYTMNLNGASLVDVESGAINMVHGVNTALLTDGTVTMSWNSKDAVSVGTDEVLFTLVLNVTESKHISEMLSINSRVTTAESYVGETYQVQGVELSLRGGDAVLDGEFALFQNEPNPFSVTSTIGFNLPTADAASVTIYDVTGKVVRVIEGDYDKGYNEIKVSNRDLGASGVLYYQLESGDFTATKKMIIIE